MPCDSHVKAGEWPKPLLQRHELNFFGFRHASQVPVNIFKTEGSGAVRSKKNLSTPCQFCEQFAENFCHASQLVMNISASELLASRITRRE
jgi:hypothetical protein